MIEQARRTKLRVFERIICGIDESESELEAAGKGLDLEAVRALTPSIVLDPGKPVDTLLDLAEETDLLVLGSRASTARGCWEASASVSGIRRRARCS
jgi:nucleotide-binding universal stress UspA family protein